MSPGAIPMDQVPRIAARVAGVIVVLIQVSLIPLVLVRRKEASATIAWILTLVFLPLLGGFLFLLFGRDRVRLGASAKRAAKAASRERMRGVLMRRKEQGQDELEPDEVALAFADAELEARLRALDPVDRPVFRVGGRLGKRTASAGNVVRAMRDGDEAIEAKFEAIAAAKKSVHAEYYLIRNDATGRRFRDLLVEAARRGCRVRLLVDGYGGLALGNAWTHPLLEAGVEVARFLPIRALGAGLHARLLGAFQWNLRNHRKILVIDGRVAFTGGVNIGDDMRRWRDTHVRIEGPAVHTLQAIFLEDWEFATERHVIDPEDFASFAPTAHDADRGFVAIVTSGPDTANEAIHRVFFAAIAGARERVFVTTPYFVPDRALLVALEAAALSGMDVKLIVPGRSNHKVTWVAGRSFYEELLEAGVAIYEYGPEMIHAKTIVVDGRIGLVGSANMDMRSFRLNYEVHALVRDAGTAQRLERLFDEDLGRSRRIELSEFRHRSVLWRVAEGAGRLVAPLL